MVEWALPPTARNVYVYMHPFGRASPSVINHLIKAGSLLSPHMFQRGYSSNTIDLTGSYPHET